MSNLIFFYELKVDVTSFHENCPQPGTFKEIHGTRNSLTAHPIILQKWHL